MKIELKDFLVCKDCVLKLNVKYQLITGQNVWLVANNGVGKTTILDCLYGQFPFSGQVIIDDIYLSRNKKQLVSMFSYLKQKPVLIEEATIIENIKLLKLELSTFTNYLSAFHFEGQLDKKIVNLSGGEKQIVGICMALSKKSKYLLLDEPASNLSHKNIEKLTEILKKEQRSIIFTSHTLINLDCEMVNITNWRCDNE